MFKMQFTDIGEGLHDGTVAEVRVKVGDTVKEGDILYSVETDKMTSEIPSPVNGVIKAILIEPGKDITVGDEIFHIETN
ncbi:biotin/lipoyl-containing protein [Mycoplasmopsis columbina]|uniref:Biotin-binding domain-containing protein n=1 Tax=Mycoplasmopsis columbina SF7 TaxID=1037410 RepID=F9UJV9_9BACT|nr:biotin-binding domain-containing protein [Mycoplasmopsis columbina SF7]VEU76831.1 pyruvate dehydrogenase E2 component [Mycoplasmopsis columbina]